MSNQAVIRAFWKKRAELDSNRWTAPELLEFELELLKSINPSPSSILDLGSGHGELSRSYAAGTANITAVDFEDRFRKAFLEKNTTFVKCNVTQFETDRTWEIVLLMGVVPYLTGKEASDVYERISRMISDGGAAVIKHQVSAAAEKIFDGYSEELGKDYWARYPSMEAELRSLRRFFHIVTPITYPDRFQRWPDTKHVAFVCKNT